MLYSKLFVAILTSLALEAFAAPTPYSLEVRKPAAVPALPAPDVFPPLKRQARRDGSKDRGKGRNKNKNNDNNDDVNIVVQQVEIDQVIQDGNAVQIVQQKVQQVLIVNGDNNRRRDDARRRNYRKKNDNVAVVMLVVQEIQVINIQDNQVQQLELFAQSAVTVGAGKDKTKTVMMTAVEILSVDVAAVDGLVAEATGEAATGIEVAATATDAAAVALATDPAALEKAQAGPGAEATATGAFVKAQDVLLYAAAPTWTEVVHDVPEVTGIPLLGAAEVAVEEPKGKEAEEAKVAEAPLGDVQPGGKAVPDFIKQISDALKGLSKKMLL